jgi:hypothetical protein
MIYHRSLKRLYFKRLLPRLSFSTMIPGKLVIVTYLLTLSYFIVMNIFLLEKAKHRITRSSISSTLANFVKSNDSSFFIKSHQQDAINPSIFSPLPVKKLMMADATHYIRSPIAELLEKIFGFSTIFPFITANSISLFHCVLSIVSVKFLVDDSLFWRQIGVVIFQFRNFLDSFDGVIYRAHANSATYKSHYGSIGYFVDAFSDVFGGLCLIGSLCIYFLKHRPFYYNRANKHHRYPEKRG